MKKYLSILIAFFLVFAVHGQSADVISQILDTEQVTYGQVCYLSAVDQGLISDDSSYSKSVKVLADEGQIPDIVDEDMPVPAANIAFIFSQMWGVKGGIMHRITKGSPRYSFKQLKADGAIKTNVDPSDFLPGYDLLNVYLACSKLYGHYDVGAVSMESD